MNDDILLLLCRISFSFVFLNAAWKCGSSSAGLKWTIEEASILFGERARLLAPLGIIAMGVGGLSILIGIHGEIGGIILAGFLVPGTLIHLRKQKEASSLGTEIRSAVAETEQGTVDQLSMSAGLGHYSSAMKNISLIGPALLFVSIGTGQYSLDQLWRG